MLDKNKTIAVMNKYGVSGQLELAQRMGVSQSRVSDLINGGRDITISTFKRICEAIGCKAEELW